MLDQVLQMQAAQIQPTGRQDYLEAMALWIPMSRMLETGRLTYPQGGPPLGTRLELDVSAYDYIEQH